ncbi:hypothetical protein F5877DRAFT_73844 [Lentinula edodes]|nr:hypothetical protein F5877DRAFT_73844 [Lentinula edodes]
MPELHRLSSITGNPDADCDIDLGADRPLSNLHSSVNDAQKTGDELDIWTMSGTTLTTDLPARPREWRSKSYDQKLHGHPDMKKEIADRDCGICFETARAASRTPCCGSLFCLEHISEWLIGPSSDGKCPSCGTPCAMRSNGSIALANAPHSPPELAHTFSYAPSPLPSPYTGPHESTVDVEPIGGNFEV